jgi:hypothetical protein
VTSDRTDHVLAAIDGALLDWSVSGDAMRWAPEPEQVDTVGPCYAEDLSPGQVAAARVDRLLATRRGGTPREMVVVFEPDTEVLDRMVAAWGEIADGAARALAPLAEAFTQATAQAGEVIAGIRDSLREGGALPKQPPADPRAHALWLRQHRGTGPVRMVQHGPRPRRHQ